MNVFYDAVVPYRNSPRDLTRLTNSIAVSWPPVAKEINVADFVALEAMRVFEPKLYNVVRSNKERLCGTRPDYGTSEDPEKELEGYLQSVAQQRQEFARTALKRLFPRLENVGYSAGFVERWEVQRLLCTAKHFDTYFRMTIGDETLSADEINAFVEKCDDKKYVKGAFQDALNSVRKNGKSKVPLLLDEINIHAPNIAKEKFEPLISTIFEIADDIDRSEDRERGFSFGDNHLRIYWLIRKLTFERCNLDERSKIFRSSCQRAQVGWLVDFASSAIDDHYPRKGGEPEPPEKCLVVKEMLDELRQHTIKTIEKAAETEKLIFHSRLPYIMYRWRDFARDSGASVKSWSYSQFASDTAVAYLSKAFTSESWSQGMGMAGLGDRVAMRQSRAAVGSLDSIMYVHMFRRRVEKLDESETLDNPYKEWVHTFLEAWRAKDRGEQRD